MATFFKMNDLILSPLPFTLQAAFCFSDVVNAYNEYGVIWINKLSIYFENLNSKMSQVILFWQINVIKSHKKKTTLTS